VPETIRRELGIGSQIGKVMRSEGHIGRGVAAVSRAVGQGLFLARGPSWPAEQEFAQGVAINIPRCHRAREF